MINRERLVNYECFLLLDRKDSNYTQKENEACHYYLEKKDDGIQDFQFKEKAAETTIE